MRAQKETFMSENGQPPQNPQQEEIEMASFQDFLNEAFRLQKMNPNGSLRRTPEFAELEKIAVDKWASAMSVEEFIKNDYFGQMNAEGLFEKGSAIGCVPVIEAWIKSGVFFKSKSEKARFVATTVVGYSPNKWGRELIENPEWLLSYCGASFGEHNRHGYANHAFVKMVKDWDNKKPVKWEHEWQQAVQDRFSALCQLFEKTEEYHSLQAIKNAGRGVVWLMNCLACAPMSEVKKALVAGLRLDNASDAETLAFLRAMADASAGFASDVRAQHGRRRPTKAQEEKRQDKAFKKTQEEAWDRWRMAIDAGLPLISQRHLDVAWQEHERAGIANACAIAIFAQEAMRHGGISKEWRDVWLVICLERPWHGEIARRAEALEAESPFQWALRHGLPIAQWTRDEMTKILARVAAGVQGDEVFTKMAQAGAVFIGDEPRKNALVIAALHANLSAAGIGALFEMGAELTIQENGGASLMAQLMDGDFCRENGIWPPKSLRTLAEAANLRAPGLARDLIRAQDKKGVCVFHLAGTLQSLSLLNFCLEFGGDINVQDKRGQTPLHKAAWRFGKKTRANFLPLAEWGRNNDFDWGLQNKEGETVAAVLAKKGPVDALAQIIETAPTALDKVDKNGVSAIDHLRKRDGLGEVLSHAESAVMMAEMTARAQSNKPKIATSGGADREEEPKKKSRRL